MKILHPRRRDVLKGSLALAALARAPRRALAAAGGPIAPIEVDVHCHSFCSSDLPIVGFVAHYIPGLSDFSRYVTKWPELVVREILRVVTKLPNASTPTATAEMAALDAALADGGHAIESFPMLSEEQAANTLGKVLRLIPFPIAAETRDSLSRYVSTIYVSAHSRAGIAATMADTYRTTTLFTPCLVDYDEWSDDRAPTDLCDQIAIQTQIVRLSLKDRIQRPGVRIHPFVAFDPRREVVRKIPAPKDAAAYRPFGDERVFDPAQPYAPPAPAAPPPPPLNKDSGALEMVRGAVEGGGFLGVKVYPPVGFAPLENAVLRRSEKLSARIDLALRALYAYCEAEEIPITAHTSPGNEYGIGYRNLVSPDRWVPVMKLYPNLRLNLGHFGHDYGIDLAHGVNAAEAWIRQASALIQAYPNVYADLSCSPLVHDPDYARRYGPYLRDIVAKFPKVKKRLMYGSDWWVNRLEPSSETFPEAIRTLLTRARTSAGDKLFTEEEVADVMGRNALRFLGFANEENRVRDGRASRRLRAFYAQAKAAPPAWLA